VKSVVFAGGEKVSKEQAGMDNARFIVIVGAGFQNKDGQFRICVG